MEGERRNRIVEKKLGKEGKEEVQAQKGVKVNWWGREV